jgi:transposase
LIRGLMSDEEWDIFEPFVAPGGLRKGRPAGDHRRVLDGIFWITRTGAAWRDLPEYFGKFGSVHRQFRRWSVSGLWDVILEAVNESGEGQDSVQMIDSTVIRAHQHSAGAKKGVRTKVLAARAVASRPRYT